jgi:Ras-related protein Rab-10
METSAKANINIEKAFSELAEAILDQTASKDSNNENQDRGVVVDRKNQEKSPAYSRCCTS